MPFDVEERSRLPHLAGWIRAACSSCRLQIEIHVSRTLRLEIAPARVRRRVSTSR
jgi:hypothetical protein